MAVLLHMYPPPLMMRSSGKTNSWGGRREGKERGYGKGEGEGAIDRGKDRARGMEMGEGKRDGEGEMGW